MGECTSARAQRASRRVYHTRVLNLSSGTEAGEWWRTWSIPGLVGRGFVEEWETPGHSGCHSEESRDPGGWMEDLGDWLTKGPLLGNSGWQCECVWAALFWHVELVGNITGAIVLDSLYIQKSCCQVETKSGTRDYCHYHIIIMVFLL